MAVNTREAEKRFFSVDGLRQFFLNMKEFPEVVFYGAMARQSWFIWMGASPLLLILMPMIAVSLGGMAALDIYLLIRSPNKNLDRWLGAVIASVCTLLASISISSLVLGTIFGFTFAAGPWIYLSGVLVFGASTIFNLGLTLWRLLESPPNSPQRMHFLQRLISQVNMLLTVGSVVGCVLFVLLFPVSVPLASSFAIACAAMTMINIAWRFMPEIYRESVKSWVGLEKPEYEAVDPLNIHESLLMLNASRDKAAHAKNAFKLTGGFMPRLFTAPDYLAQLKGFDAYDRIPFLKTCIGQYSKRLHNSGNDAVRVQSKKSCVGEMLENLSRMENGKPIQALKIEQYKELYQSFWRESEMEALHKAYEYLTEEYCSLDEAQRNQEFQSAFSKP